MTIQHVPLTEANRRMDQIRKFAHSEGLLSGVEQLARLLMANSLAEAARAISTADAAAWV